MAKKEKYKFIYICPVCETKRFITEKEDQEIESFICAKCGYGSQTTKTVLRYASETEIF